MAAGPVEVTSAARPPGRSAVQRCHWSSCSLISRDPDSAALSDAIPAAALSNACLHCLSRSFKRAPLSKVISILIFIVVLLCLFLFSLLAASLPVNQKGASFLSKRVLLGSPRSSLRVAAALKHVLFCGPLSAFVTTMLHVACRACHPILIANGEDCEAV